MTKWALDPKQKRGNECVALYTNVTIRPGLAERLVMEGFLSGGSVITSCSSESEG